ncbi:MAG: YfcE family phosphodiesterase [Candidatus Thorarchaeota archaeon]
MRVLVFGDTHIPNRRDAIPKAFHEHIAGQKYDMALVTGDLVREHEMRKALPPLPRTFIVRGNMDYSLSEHNHHEQIQLGEFNILLLHGTQLRPRGNIHQLWEIATNIGADIGVHGHTHNATVDLYNDKLFLNPGTITGATGGWSGRQEASFLEIEIDTLKLMVRLHRSNWDVFKTSEIEFVKEDDIIRAA